jgi:hypothetical protein
VTAHPLSTYRVHFQLGDHQYRLEDGVIDLWNVMAGVWDMCPADMAERALEYVRRELAPHLAAIEEARSR